MKLGSKKPVEPLGVDWLAMRLQRPREMRLSDLTVDNDGRPLIGTPLGRKQLELKGCIARETFKWGKLIGWQGRNNEHPIIEYADGTYEVMESLAQTNWKQV